MDSSSIQSNPSSRRSCKYDVFISFRGDTRNNFADHLYYHLTKRGISTFRDDKKLQKGLDLSKQLTEAIEGSRVSIIVFSKDYPGSKWCLKEMAAIVKCNKQYEQIVFSVFHDVDPSDVRNQKGVYEKHLTELTEEWKSDMTILANLVGWDVRNKSEVDEIGNIVQAVIGVLDHKFSGFAEDLVGIQSCDRVPKLQSLLQLNSTDKCHQVLGIWGMAGIGKTTHAKALYDKISYQFDNACFIENVSKIYREGGGKSGGTTAIQKIILRQAFDEQNLESNSPIKIAGNINKRLSNENLPNEKVLIVLDNIDQLEQLELAIKPESLPAGSRIIITTRNKHILKVYGAAVQIYKVPLLTNDEARELLYEKAFPKGKHPSNGDEKLIPEELILEALEYADGLPLAIKKLGELLHSRDAIEWEDALKRLWKDSEEGVMEVLRTSYEDLRDREKEIFLDSACFFSGKREDYVKRILACCGLHPGIGIKTLVEKSLITIENQNIQVHRQLQELGKKIVQEEFPKKPEKWNRLWRSMDFRRAVKAQPREILVEALVLDQEEDVSMSCPLEAKKFPKMKDLRLLILYLKKFHVNLNFLPSKLRYFAWHGYPSNSLPLDFELEELVELHIPCSSIHRLQQEGNEVDPDTGLNLRGIPNLERLDLTKCTNLSEVCLSIGSLSKLAFLSLRNCEKLDNLIFSGGSESNSNSLKVLDLAGCKNLATMPDFGRIPNLEGLDLTGCTKLSMVPTSIGSLEKLAFLSLRNCSYLANLIPDGVHEFKSNSLKVLVLAGCTELSRMPNSIKIPNLERLDLTGCTNLQYVHLSIGSLQKLVVLSLQNCSNLVDLVLHTVNDSNSSSLKVLNLSGCAELTRTPDFTSIPSLEWLNLEHCTSLTEINESIGVLTELKLLNLRYCTNLKIIPHSINDLINSLEILDFYGCSKLESLPLRQRTMGAVDSLESQNLIYLNLGFCNLGEVPVAIGQLSCLERLNLEGNNFVTLPSTIKELSSLAFLNLSHCKKLQSLPELPSTSASSVGRCFSTVGEAHRHRSGLYIFNCPELGSRDNHDNNSSQSKGEMERHSNKLAHLWLERLLQEPRHFRSGFDIVIPGREIPEWFDPQFEGGSIRIRQCSDVDDDNNWIGIAFCVALVVNCDSETSVSSYDPFYLAFEDGQVEWSFDRPLHLDQVDVDGSQHLWLIYISRDHCPFVKAGTRVKFIARCPSVELKNWGFCWLVKQDMGPQNPPLQLLNTSQRNKALHLPPSYEHESNGYSEPTTPANTLLDLSVMTKEEKK